MPRFAKTGELPPGEARRSSTTRPEPLGPRPGPVPGHHSDAVKAVLLAAALIAGWFLFQELASLFVLVVIAIVIALPLGAVATALERRGVPRGIGALLALLGGLGVLAGILALTIPPFVDQVNRFVDDVPRIVDDLRRQIGEATGGGTAGESLQSSLRDIADDPTPLLGPVAAIGLGVAGAAATLILVLIGAYYMAVNPRPLIDGLLSLFPPERRGRAAEVLDDIRSSWLGWLRGVGVDMIVSGVLLWAGLTLIGLDYALVFAVFSALLVVVPYFGSIAGGIPPVLFAFAESPTMALIVLVVYLAVQQVEANVIIPLVMSRAVKLHPAVVLVGVVVVGRLLGFVGLLVAVPILAATIILARELWVKPLNEEAEAAQPG